VHIILWDKCWDCSAGVRIISSIQLTSIIRSLKEAQKLKKVTKRNEKTAVKRLISTE